jgi:hypothetical protein
MRVCNEKHGMELWNLLKRWFIVLLQFNKNISYKTQHLTYRLLRGYIFYKYRSLHLKSNLLFSNSTSSLATGVGCEAHIWTTSRSHSRLHSFKMVLVQRTRIRMRCYHDFKITQVISSAIYASINSAYLKREALRWMCYRYRSLQNHCLIIRSVHLPFVDHSPSLFHNSIFVHLLVWFLQWVHCQLMQHVTTKH